MIFPIVKIIFKIKFFIFCVEIVFFRFRVSFSLPKFVILLFGRLKSTLPTAIKKDERKADDRHIKDQEIYYNKFQIGGVDYDVEIFVDKPASGDKNSYYAGHKATKIKITPRDSQVAENSFNLHSKGASIIIPLLEQI